MASWQPSLLIVLLPCAVNAIFIAPNRSVSFWYAPASGDLNQTIDVLTRNQGAVTSVMLYCGHKVDGSGRLVGSVSSLCDDGQGGGLIHVLAKLRIGVEFVVNDGSTNVTAHKLFMNDPSSIPALVEIGKKYKIYGWNLDLEPQKVPGTVSDAAVYASFCVKLRSALNAQGIRLSIDVAQWSPMLSQFATLGPTVDRMMNMETYNADSMSGWLNGDSYGGYYNKFMNSGGPLVSKCPGLGSWPSAKCSSHACWTTTSASVAPRMARIAADGVPEVALFRLYGDQSSKTPPDQRWPEDFWWPELKKYLSGSTAQQHLV